MKRALLLLVLLTSAGRIYPCSCAGIATFCETITDPDGKLWESIDLVRGTVTFSAETGARIKVDKLYFGDWDQNDFFIRNGSPASCSVSTQSWAVGDELLLALDLIAGLDTFGLSICSVQWLRIEGGLARGPVAPGIDQFPPSEILSLPGCGGLGRVLSLSARLYPNPTTSQLRLEIEGADTLTGTWEIYDAAGHLLLRERQVVISDLIFTLPDWPGGLYLLVVRTPFDRRTFRFIIAE